jgi:apolipoprotein N-acyltransferase
MPSLIPVSSEAHTAAPRSLRFAVVAEDVDEVRDPNAHVSVADRLIEVARATPPVDVVLLPEEFSLTSMFWSADEAKGFLQSHFGNREVVIVSTRGDLFAADERNAIVEAKKLTYESTTKGEIGRYVKLNLMPLGEYAPAFTKTFFSLIGDAQLHDYIDTVRAPIPRGSAAEAAEFRGGKIGGLRCSDMLSPSRYRSLATEGGAHVLVNLANQFWFHGSRALYWKTVQMAKVHAAQNRLPLLVANNRAPSFVVDRTGRVIAESAWGSRGALYVDAP